MALTTNLVSYWKLDESSGNAADSVGSNTLTNTNTVTYATGKINNGANFVAASTQYLSHIDDATLKPTNVTVSAWAKLASNPTNAAIIDKGGLGGDYAIFKEGSNIKFRVRTNGTDRTVTYAWTPDTNWHFYTLVYDGSNIYGYVDGISVGSAAATGTYNTSASAFTVGTRSDLGSYYWDGLIDEIGIWSRALASDEIVTIYNGGTGNQYLFQRIDATGYYGSNDDYENNGTTSPAIQSFQVSSTSVVPAISFLGSKGNGASGTFKFEIRSAWNSGVLATTGTLNTSTLSTYGSPAWNNLSFTSNVSLSASTTYYLVYTALSGSATDEVRWSTDTTSPTYAGGSYISGADGSAVTSKDRNFVIYANTVQNLTLTAAVGTFTLTGYAVTILKVKQLIAAVGNFIVTGIAAVLHVHQIVWTGQSKNSATYTSQTKNSSTWTSQNKS